MSTDKWNNRLSEVHNHFEDPQRKNETKPKTTHSAATAIRFLVAISGDALQRPPLPSLARALGGPLFASSVWHVNAHGRRRKKID